MKSREQCSASEATETREEVRRRQQGWMAQRAAQMERESLRSDLLKDDPLQAGFDSRGSTSVDSTRPAQSRISDDRVLDQITGLCNFAIFLALSLGFMNSLNGAM